MSAAPPRPGKGRQNHANCVDHSRRGCGGGQLDSVRGGRDLEHGLRLSRRQLPHPEHPAVHRGCADRERRRTGDHAAQQPGAVQVARNQTAQIPIGEILLVQFGNEDPLFEASAIPFLAKTYEERFASQGMRVLYGVPWPVQGFYLDMPINSTADVEGLKFRAYSAMTARMAEEMGMLPATIAFSEIPQAFATGLVSVIYTSPQTGIDSQAWDFTQHFTNVGGNFSMNLVIANEDAFQALAPEGQQALLDAAAKAEARGWQMSQDVTTEQIQTLKDNGMVVATPTPEFLAELEAIGGTLTAEWVEKAGDVGQEVVDKLAGQ